MQEKDRKKNNAASTPRILIFEEDSTNQYLLEKVLMKNGCAAVVVGKASEVLGRLTTQSEKYDLIIINVCAPIEDDIDLVRTIRSLSDQDVSSIPILATTTAINPDIKQKCQAEGIVDVIMKPFDIAELCQKIKQCIHCTVKTHGTVKTHESMNPTNTIS